MIQPAHGTSRRLQLGDEEQIDERLARRAHELEGRLAKFGTAGIQKPKELLEFVNNLYFYNTTTTTTTTGEAEYYTAGTGCIMYSSTLASANLARRVAAKTRTGAGGGGAMVTQTHTTSQVRGASSTAQKPPHRLLARRLLRREPRDLLSWRPLLEACA